MNKPMNPSFQPPGDYEQDKGEYHNETQGIHDQSQAQINMNNPASNNNRPQITQQKTFNSKLMDDSDINNTNNNKELGCYEDCLGCCGTFFGTLRAWCPCICCCCPYPFVQVPTAFTGLLEEFGKYNQMLKPGLHQINPWTTVVKMVDLRTRIIDLPRQQILTQDNITINIDSVVYYRVIEPRKAAYRVSNVNQSVTEVAISTLRTICGEYVLQELLEQREHIADAIQEFMYSQIQNWGVFVDNLLIKDMQLNPDLQNDLSSAAKQKRIAESKMISAKADVQSAKLFRQAADSLDSQAAMQIRYLQTIQLIGKGSAPKIMFLPMQPKSTK